MLGRRCAFLFRYKNWAEAVAWYRKAVEETDDSSSDDFGLIEPSYSILAHIAEMHRNGGHGLVQDLQTAGDLYSEAADIAMNAMKGKLSTKYFMLAEEVWGEMED